ncbi:MAG: aminotransferase class IV [Patescibacteria group bacterium]
MNTNQKTNNNIEKVVWWNGKLIPESEAKVSIYDSALMFGDVVFDMTRSFNKKQFKLREHLERLYDGLKFLEIPIDITMDEMEKHCHEVIEANDPIFRQDDEHRLMIDVTRGLLSIYEGIAGARKGPNIIIADFPFRWTVKGMGKLYDVGVDAVIPAQRTIPASLLEQKVKNRNRLHLLMANIQVSKYKGENAWALLLDPDGFIAEGTGGNFFIVKNGKLVTPEPRNILRGIRRRYVIEELCPQLGLECEEKNLELYDVVTADEAFYTATAFSIMPATKINGLKIGDGKVGKITKTLLDTWSKNVGVDIVQQIKKFNAESEEGSVGPTPYSFGKNK